MSKHLLIVDGMALLFRSFFASAAMNQFIRLEDGTPTNGVQGFARHVLTAQNMMQPTHIAICWIWGSTHSAMSYLMGIKLIDRLHQKK